MRKTTGTRWDASRTTAVLAQKVRSVVGGAVGWDASHRVPDTADRDARFAAIQHAIERAYLATTAAKKGLS